MWRWPPENQVARGALDTASSESRGLRSNLESCRTNSRSGAAFGPFLPGKPHPSLQLCNKDVCTICSSQADPPSHLITPSAMGNAIIQSILEGETMRPILFLAGLMFGWWVGSLGAQAQSKSDPPIDPAKSGASTRQVPAADAPSRDRAEDRKQRREHRKQVRQRLRHHR